MDTFIVKANNGNLEFKSDNQKELFRKRLLQIDGKEFALTVNERKPKRSERQNAYYWLYVGILSNEIGYTPDELHTMFKGKFLTREIKEVMGQKTRITKSTTDLSKSEFAEYIMEIETFTGIQAPNTDEYYEFNLSYHK